MTDGTFLPRLDILPSSQRALWNELGSTPDTFALYGGTALALRLGHRTSVDFDFFSRQAFDPDKLARAVPYLRGAERVQVDANTLTCRVERGGPVLVSFFGGLGLGQVAQYDRAGGTGIEVASLLDIAGTKAAVIQKRAQLKDYIDIDALIRHGVSLDTVLAAGQVVHGRGFNPVITLKALSYFGDVARLPAAVRKRLTAAITGTDPTRLPDLVSHAVRPHTDGYEP